MNNPVRLFNRVDNLEGSVTGSVSDMVEGLGELLAGQDTPFSTSMNKSTWAEALKYSVLTVN